MEQRLNKGAVPFDTAPLIIQGAPWRIRTVDLGIRSPLLYPTELMEHKTASPSGYKSTRLVNYNLLKLVVVRLADLIHGTIHT